MTSNSLSTTSSTELFNLAANYHKCSKSANTRSTYATAWKNYTQWCAFQQQDPMTTESKESLVAFYLSDMAGNGKLKLASIKCYLMGIKVSYRDRGVELDLKHTGLRGVIRGIQRTLNPRQTRKEPILIEDLVAMVDAIPIERNGTPWLQGIRDRAILLIGFCGAFRRSELVSLTVEDLKWQRDGCIANVARSKTDQDGAGQDKIIPYGANSITCPVRALKDWLDASKITSGPIFRAIIGDTLSSRPLCPAVVARIVQRNPHIGDRKAQFGGHSLRAGFVTTAAIKKVPESSIMEQTGHRSSAMLRVYIRRGNSFRDSAASMVGL